MKILALYAENVKKLRAVDIRPNGNVVVVTGENGAGKTSVLDSIEYALGGAAHLAAVPVRIGADELEIRLDLGTVIVRREMMTGGRSTLYVESRDGARYPQPQKFVDAFYNELTFDPIAFGRLPAKARLESLRSLVKLDVDVDKLQADHDRAFAQRTEWNRKVRQLIEREAAARERVDDQAPAELIDLSPILDKIEEASEVNSAYDREVNARAARAQRRINLTADAEKVAREIRALELRHAEIRAELEVIDNNINTDAELPMRVDVSELRRAYEQAQTENNIRQAQNRLREAHQSVATELAAAKKTVENFTRTIENAQQQKAESMARATMPIAGLAFGDGEVLYNGLPFDQASAAEQLRVSFAMAMAMNPKLRVVLIRDGSLLTDKSFALLCDMANEHDFQVWIEMASSDGKVGFLIEEGELVAVDGVPIERQLERPVDREVAAATEGELAIGASHQGDERPLTDDELAELEG